MVSYANSFIKEYTTNLEGGSDAVIYSCYKAFLYMLVS
jgi:hypothetical protein